MSGGYSKRTEVAAKAHALDPGVLFVQSQAMNSTNARPEPTLDLEGSHERASIRCRETAETAQDLGSRRRDVQSDGAKALQFPWEEASPPGRFDPFHKSRKRGCPAASRSWSSHSGSPAYAHAHHSARSSS